MHFLFNKEQEGLGCLVLLLYSNESYQNYLAKTHLRLKSCHANTLIKSPLGTTNQWADYISFRIGLHLFVQHLDEMSILSFGFCSH